ncbi:MAG: rod shape-determining protein MreC [Methylobacter tundripaludum]|nr:rod shape-determining protein MreC [Methylobacter tundripaludum]
MAIIASVALLITEHRSHRLDSLRATLSVLVDPLKYLVDLPTVLIEQTTESVRSYSTLKKENAQLRDEQFIDKTRLLKFESLEKENIRLRALLENSFKLGEQLLIAELLSINTAPYENIVVVNKGTRFGVHPQQPVLDANGVVGQVFRALPFSSEIMLITDPNHAIPVQVNRNGLLTIAVGSGQLNRLNLPFLPNNADIRPGDLLITSGLGGTFPSGYPVAVVDDFTPMSNKPFVNITATPKAMLDRNRELLIVWSDSSPVSLTTPLSEKPTESPPHDQPAGTGTVGNALPAASGSARNTPAGINRDDKSAGSGLAHKTPVAEQADTDNDE